MNLQLKYDENEYVDLTKGGDTGFRMVPQKDDIRKFEATALCDNRRKKTDIGLSRDSKRPVARFVSVVEYL